MATIQKQAESYPEAVYSAIGLDQLLTYAVESVIDRGDDCTFENIVLECFTKFPRKFGFERFPEWPDSARVNKTWLRCRTDKGWIVGNVKSGFKLTPAGTVIARQVDQQLNGRNGAVSPTTASTRSREAAAVKYIQDTAVYKNWRADKNAFTMRFTEFVALLNATLETPRRVLRQNLNFYKGSARAVSAAVVQEFLEDCERRFLSELRES